MLVPITSKPGTSRKSKTGSWRTNVKPHFKQEKCVACRMCVLICPECCVEGEAKNTFQYDPDYCKGCGNCVAICPAKDIEMVPEGGA